MGVYAAEAAMIVAYEMEDVFVDGLGTVEITSGGAVRLVFFNERGGEKIARFAMVINPAPAIAGMAKLTVALTGGASCDKLGPCLTRVLRLAN